MKPLAVLAAILLLAIPAPLSAEEAAHDSIIPPSAFTAIRSAGPGAPGYHPALHQPSTRKEVPAVRTSVKPSPSAASLAGTASWWASFGDGVYAALPGYVAGTHVTIRVCAAGRCLGGIPVITSCACFVGTPQERIVDLSPGVLAALRLDPRLGLFHVSIEEVP